MGPAACKAAAAAAKRAAPPAPPGGEADAAPKKKKKKQKQKADPPKTDASSGAGTSRDASLPGAGARSGAAGGAAGGGAAGGDAVRLPAAEKPAPPQRTEREIAEEVAKAAADARLREQLMAAIVQARKRATLAGAPPPTAKELHAAVSEPLHALPPTSLAAVKKCMSLLVAMQRAGTKPQPAAGE